MSSTVHIHVIIGGTLPNLTTCTNLKPTVPSATAGFADGFPHGLGGGDGDGGEVAAVAAALKEKVESAARLPDIQNTVAVRASLAQEFVRAAAEQLRVCETLIHDQHLQHQVSVASRTD